MPAGVASAHAARPAITGPMPAPAQHTVAPSSADAHVFDVVHPILLSHVRRHNSAGVVALLGLPELANAPLFWQTCTYRAGLVGSLVSFVVEQTGQHAVPWPAERRQPGWTSPAPDGGGGASTPSPLQEKEGTLHKEGDSDASVQAASPAAVAAVATEGRSGLGAAPLTPCDLYCLVHRCLYPAHHRLPDWLACGGPDDEAVEQAEGKRREEGETTMASGQPPSAYTVMLNALLSSHSVTPAASSVLFQSRAGDGDAVRSLRESCSGVDGDRATLQDARDLQRYLFSVLTQLERIIRAQGTCTQQPPSPASSGAQTHPSPKPEPPKRVREGCDDSVQLDALAAVLLEHYVDFTYSHPRRESLAEAQAHDETFTDSEQNGASLVAPGNGRSVTPPPARASANSGAVAPVSAARNTKGSAPQGPEPNSRDSSSHKNSTGTPATTHAEPLQQIQEAESRTEVDAVTMLQRLPALSATRWSVAASAPAAAAAETQRRQGEERPTAGTAAASTNAAPQPSAPVPASKRGTGSSPEKTAVPPARMTQQQRDAEAARVAAAIHAFDAFTASLEQLQPSSTARPAQHTAGGNSSSNSSSKSKNSGGVHDAASRQGSFVEAQRQRGTSARTSAAPSSAAVVPAAPPPPPHPTTRKQPPSSSVAAPPAAAPAGREPRRRHKFSAKEDAAILQGVGRFGQGPGAFQYVFHAYRNVWREGRTATHLYDHWRGALRRRAVAAVSAEALGSVGEGEGEGEGGEEEGGEGGREGSRGERENGRGRRGGRTGRARADWAEQELSSDIESSEEESDE